MRYKMLVFTFFLQFALIAMAFINASLPVFFGTEVRVRAYGYDPRDLLAGNFVRIDYGIRLDKDIGGDEIFVLLENDNGIFKFGKKVFEKPKDGLFIKAKRTSKYSKELKIGAEQYFATKDRALEIERKLRNMPNDEFGAIGTLKVFNGKARIVGFELARQSDIKVD